MVKHREVFMKVPREQGKAYMRIRSGHGNGYGAYVYFPYGKNRTPHRGKEAENEKDHQPHRLFWADHPL